MRQAATHRYLLPSVVLLALALIAVPASAEVYIVNLKNGNTFLSKYKPIQASFDSNKLLIMTDVGNTISVHKDDILEVIADSEHRGFGTVLDTSTIMIGYTANDAPDMNNPDVAAAMAAAANFQAQQQQFARPVYNTPLVAQPNQGGGIPISFAASGSVPVSAAQGAIRPN